MTKPSDVATTLEQLRADHRHAEQRLQELGRHLSLSPEEQVEVAHLKKRKLHLKDEIRSLAARLDAA
jgi:uncharacterized protein YdcH (DUF465 family)